MLLFIFLLLLLLYINTSLSYREKFLIKALTREKENQIFPAKGALLYFSSLLFLSSFEQMPLSAFIAAVLALAIGDGFSTLGGKAFNTKQKTFLGSFLGFIPLFFSYLLMNFSIPFSFIVAVFAMLIERLSFIDDNFLIPFSVSAFVILLYSYGIY